MLANLLSEIRRRHLWPIPLVALLVAVAAPLLFLKSAPPDAPLASAAAPPVVQEGALPARAERLLAATDAAKGAPAHRASTASDPFEPPASHGDAAPSPPADATAAATAKTTATAGTAGSATATEPSATAPIPVVITNSDGSKTTSTSTPPIGDEPATTSTSTTTSAAPAEAMLVDVRFGERIPAQLHRAIPRLQTFVAGGRVVAIFVKYSPNRHKAVFAIAPKTIIEGDIECRRKEGLCRYVDIPAGKGVRLTTLATDGTLVTRRLDVVRTQRASQTGAQAASTGTPDDGSCLLDKMLALTATDMPLASDACTS